MEENEQLIGLINNDFRELNDGLVVSGDQHERSEIRQQLAYVISKLIERNFEQLCQAMYRLDVSEEKFHEVLTESPVEEIPYRIADLVIEREIQKVKTRIAYKRKEL